MVVGFAARAFDFKAARAMANSLLQFLQRCFIFRSTLYVSDKIPLPREVAALKLKQAYSAWLACRCSRTGTSPSYLIAGDFRPNTVIADSSTAGDTKKGAHFRTIKARCVGAAD